MITYIGGVIGSGGAGEPDGVIVTVKSENNGRIDMKLRWLVREEEIFEGERYFGIAVRSIITIKILQYYDDDANEWRDVPEEAESD